MAQNDSTAECSLKLSDPGLTTRIGYHAFALSNQCLASGQLESDVIVLHGSGIGLDQMTLAGQRVLRKQIVRNTSLEHVSIDTVTRVRDQTRAETENQRGNFKQI
jgi:hypothetical protein